jgi:hypothetical protein
MKQSLASGRTTAWQRASSSITAAVEHGKQRSASLSAAQASIEESAAAADQDHDHDDEERVSVHVFELTPGGR